MTEQTERERLEALFTKLHDGKSARWLDHYGEPGLSAKGRRFNALMGLNAYLDAALMLVPEGLVWAVAIRDGGIAMASVRGSSLISSDGDIKEAATPALALCAAIEAAIAREGE